MQDIRKPYTRSRSNNDLQSRVEQFEAARYRRDDDYYEDEPVQIPVSKTRRDVRAMDMYPRKRASDGYEDDGDSEDEDRPRRLLSDSGLRNRYIRKKNSLGAMISVVGVVLIVAFVGLYTYVFNSATITIVPKYKDITDLGRPLLFSKDGADSNAIPYIVETTSLSKSKTLTLSETRKIETKASGKIIIYNNYDGTPQKLIKNTRFLSAKGKIYRINQSVEVPGKTGGTPGSVEVTVFADNTGADYNIDTTTFSIPGFAGSPRENAFYANTKGPITGGASGTTESVSLSDLNAAKDSLAVELEKEIQIEVKKITKDGYVPMYSAVEITYDDNEQEVLLGRSSVYKVTATGHVILANESKLAEALAKNFSDYDNEPVRLTHVDTLVFTRKSTDSILGGSTSSISILVEGKPRVVWESDADVVKEMLKGKKRDEFKPLMKTVNSIESAEISFSPLWLSSFPDELDKIVVNNSLPKR